MSRHVRAWTVPKAWTDRPADDLFVWRTADFVLLGQREGEALVIARGWLRGDEMKNVRRWRFTSERTFLGQIRRLVRDDSADPANAEAAVTAATAWLGSGASLD